MYCMQCCGTWGDGVSGLGLVSMLPYHRHDLWLFLFSSFFLLLFLEMGVVFDCDIILCARCVIIVRRIDVSSSSRDSFS